MVAVGGGPSGGEDVVSLNILPGVASADGWKGISMDRMEDTETHNSF